MVKWARPQSKRAWLRIAEAWREMADAWTAAQQSFFGGDIYRAQLKGRNGNPVSCFGLCQCLDYLCTAGRITNFERLEMAIPINAKRDYDADGYKWPCDAAGAKARARFCKRQAKLAEAKAAGE